MAIRKFKCEVVTTKEIVVELDDAVMDKEWMAHFKKYFYDFDYLEDHAEHIAQHHARFEDHQFIEGYGKIGINTEFPLPEGKYINVKTVLEDTEVSLDEILEGQK